MEELSTHPTFLVVGIAIAGGIVFYLYCRFLMFFDKLRIKWKVRSSGGIVKEIKYTFFGSGWFGEKGERRYRVKYELSNGAEQTATCKTSFLSGVYWTGNTLPQFSNTGSIYNSSSCIYCGEQLEEKWNFCPGCGTSTSKLFNTEQIKD